MYIYMYFSASRVSTASLNTIHTLIGALVFCNMMSRACCNIFQKCVLSIFNMYPKDQICHIQPYSISKFVLTLYHVQHVP